MGVEIHGYHTLDFFHRRRCKAFYRSLLVVTVIDLRPDEHKVVVPGSWIVVNIKDSPRVMVTMMTVMMPRNCKEC